MVIEEYFDKEFCEYCWDITTHYIKEISEKEDIKIIKECTICYTEKKEVKLTNGNSIKCNYFNV